VAWEIANAQMYAVASLFMLGDLRQLGATVPALVREARKRGNLLSATNLRLGFFSHVVWLAADEPGRARQDLKDAMAAWVKGFDLPHLWARGAETDIELYCGDPIEIEPVATGRVLARVLDRFTQAALILGRSVRGRRRLAAAVQAAGEARAAHLAQALAHARTIERQRMPWGNSLASLIRAGCAATDGRAAEADGLLRAAEQSFGAAGMALYAQACRARRGELLGGPDGAALQDVAFGWMREQGVRNPPRMLAVLAPGSFSRPAP
jgi:hypothetical protein